MSDELKLHWDVWIFPSGEIGEMSMVPNPIMWGPHTAEQVFTMSEIQTLRKLKEEYIQEGMSISEIREIEKEIKQIVIDARI